MGLLQYSLGRFSIVGIANTLVGLAVIYICMGIFGLSVQGSNAIGYATGLVVGFLLNRRWTFQHTERPGPALLRYAAVVLAAYLANLAIVVLLVDQLRQNHYIAQAAGILPYTLITYLGSKHFAFAVRG